MSSVAVVSIDVQRDFLDPTMPSAVGAWEKAFCVPGLRALLSHAAASGWIVVHVGTRHADRRTLPHHKARHEAPLYCQAGTVGAEFVVGPKEGERPVYKTWYNAFTNTELEARLRGIDKVVIAGVATDCCILQTAYEADRLGFMTFVPLQAVSASKKRAFVAGLNSIAKSAATIVDLDRLSRGESLEGSAIDPGDVESSAKRWFKDQAAALARAGNPPGLSQLLALLESR